MAQDRHKSYTNNKKTTKEYKVGEHVFLRVKPKKSKLRLGLYAKLAPRYVGPFEILARIGPVAYQLALPAYIRIHDVFHISLLKKYIVEQSHIINWDNVQVKPEGDFHTEPMCILDKREIQLQKHTTVQVKVQLKHYSEEEATWEKEETMRQNLSCFIYKFCWY